jgi:hypothetical protein
MVSGGHQVQRKNYGLANCSADRMARPIKEKTAGFPPAVLSSAV